MSAQFTPAPWLVHATNRLVCQADGAFKKIEVKDGAVHGDDLPNNICLLRDPSENFSEDETLANGFLIAAAPELYEAGVHALRELDCLAACIYHDDQRQEVQAFADRFRAVLAKARGETL